MVGVLNLPIVHFSVYWWNSLHQGSSMMTKDALAPVYAYPLLIMMLAYLSAFGSLWLVGSQVLSNQCSRSIAHTPCR